MHRFTKNPILITYVLLYENPAFSETATEAEKKIRYIPVKADEGKPPIYLDPNNRIAAFFSSAEVKISGQTVSMPWMINDYQGVYQAVNRACLSEDDRLELFGDATSFRSKNERTYVTTTKEGSSTATLSDELKAKYAELNFGNPGGYRYRTIKESMDGIPLIGMPKSFPLCKILGEDHLDQEHQFLVPGTEINISLHKTQPFNKYFEHGKVKRQKSR